MARKAKPSPLEHKNNRKKCRKWRLYISIGTDSDGNRVKTSRRFEGTETEAQAEIDRLEAELRVASPSKMTIDQYCDEWLKRRKGVVASSSYQKDQRAVRNIKRLFGGTLLRDLTPVMIEDAYRNMLVKGGAKGKPCRPSYVSDQMTALSIILGDAVRRGVLRKNPVLLAKRIKKRTPQRDVPTPEELRGILSKLDVRDSRQMVAFLTGSMGLRRGEALGLNWSDVDYDGKVVHVRRVYRQTCELVDETKTKSGKRDLPLPDWIADHFKIRETRAREDIAWQTRDSEDEEETPWGDRPVCCDAFGERTTPNAASKWWGENRHKFGATCTEHDLRHSYLTSLVLLNERIDPASLQAIAGHSSANLTLSIYTHANMSSKHDVVEAVSDKLDPATLPPEE